MIWGNKVDESKENESSSTVLNRFFDDLWLIMPEHSAHHKILLFYGGQKTPIFE